MNDIDQVVQHARTFGIETPTLKSARVRVEKLQKKTWENSNASRHLGAVW